MPRHTMALSSLSVTCIVLSIPSVLCCSSMSDSPCGEASPVQYRVPTAITASWVCTGVRAFHSHSHSTSFPSIAYLPSVTAASFLYDKYSWQYSHTHGCTHMAMCSVPSVVHIRYTSLVSFSSSYAATWYIHLRCDAGMIRNTFHFPWPGIPGHSKDKS